MSAGRCRNCALDIAAEVGTPGPDFHRTWSPVGVPGGVRQLRPGNCPGGPGGRPRDALTGNAKLAAGPVPGGPGCFQRTSAPVLRPASATPGKLLLAGGPLNKAEASLSGAGEPAPVGPRPQAMTPKAKGPSDAWPLQTGALAQRVSWPAPPGGLLHMAVDLAPEYVPESLPPQPARACWLLPDELVHMPEALLPP